MPRPILLCTIGTSLFSPNLTNLKRTLKDDETKPDDKKAIKPASRLIAKALATAFEAKDWNAVDRHLAELPPTERLCGAEINSVSSLLAEGYTPANASVFLFHSIPTTGERSRASWPGTSTPEGTCRSR